MTRNYRVYYSVTTYGEIDVEATSPTEAQSIVEDGGDVDMGSARVRSDEVEVYDVEMRK
jgi:hypothetical protein